MIVPACSNGENQRLEIDLSVLDNAITHELETKGLRDY